MTGPLAQAVIAHFDSVFAGPNGDYPALLETLAGLTAQQAAWKPAPEGNSIWQIVDHLVKSKEWQVEMLAKGQAQVHPWIQPSGEAAAWDALVARLKAAHQAQKAALQRLEDEEWLAYPDPETHRTLLELVLSSGSAHEAHHIGQISYLRGLQGLA